MHLKKIKLAGFKSFVDPTTVHLPGRLTGIVGPNGCGKSNLIDAVRWVMGESSAKQLRGDSLADVIFNGSTSRKPVGQASIELVFDNSAGRLGGEYAGYAEIAIRRLLSRDGQSVYFLNGSRCRRRDITDIFLGTGLGPRSYAIIEQGMITRLVDAGPEQLRQFLEEAAGISKYKDRRRETESRIANTRENLNRISDLRDELGKQLEKLQRQAKNAERFRVLKARERELKAGLLAVRWRSEDAAASGAEAHCQQIELQLEGRVAEQTRVESRLEAIREEQHVANETLAAVQARFYGAGSDVSRVEQAIRHERDITHQRKEELARLRQSDSETAGHIRADEQRIAEIEDYLRVHEPQLAEAQSAATVAREQLQRAESDLGRWRDARDELNTLRQDPQKVAHVERTRIDHHERQLVKLQQRRTRIGEEQRSGAASSEQPDVSLLLARESELGRQLTGLEADIAALDLEERELRAAESDAQRQLNAGRARLGECGGRLASLETLQEDALGGGGGERESWLAERGLADSKRLAELVQAQNGWELAVESALGPWLEGIPVASLDELAPGLQECTEAMALYEIPQSDTATARAADDRQLLLDKVSPKQMVEGVLEGVFCSSSVTHALTQRGTLGSGECLVTPDGTRVGRTWVALERVREDSDSVLVREREIEALRGEIELETERVTEAEGLLDQGRSALVAVDSRRREIQRESTELHRRQAEMQARINALQSRMEQVERRRSTLEREHAETETETTREREGLAEARRNLEAALADLGTLERGREQLEADRRGIEEQADGCRLEVRVVVERLGQLQVGVESRRSTLESLQVSCARQRQQRAGLEGQIATLDEQVAATEAPTLDLERELEELLQVKSGVEEELQRARITLEQTESRLRDTDRERLQQEQGMLAVREELQKQRLAAGEARARRDAMAEQMSDTGLDLSAALEMVGEDPEVAAWSEELAQVERRIQRLGAINLAAIDEYSQESERKSYLDAQHADLTEALDTLEQAMRRIDRETRSRFQAMFDKINEGLSGLFPRLFGGGQAYLEMTGDDVLDSGVAIMARPPGKRVTNIHLLSGGEKALTAISLVFTIFQLNPAPFCMLDEVDAPLDEANVGRYSALVNEMSEKVQLIVITHNKTTMEVVEHLMGVTMHEPGCSRLVSVDVEEAARLAAV